MIDINFIIFSLVVIIILSIFKVEGLLVLLIFLLFININSSYIDEEDDQPNFTKSKITTNSESFQPEEAKKEDTKATEPTVPIMNDNMYGAFYDEWNTQRLSYTNSYTDPMPRIIKSGAETTADIDSANTLLWQRRARDKECSDGWASKNADYYKYHYAEELDTEAAREWWGRDEH